MTDTTVLIEPVLATAFHEAGHAAAYVYFQHTIRLVTINPDGTGRVVAVGPEAYEPRHRKQIAMERIISLYSGLPGERLFDPSADVAVGGDDDAAAERLCKQYAVVPSNLIYMTEGGMDRYLARLRIGAERLVKRLQEPIERLAKVLAVRGTMTGAELERVVSMVELTAFRITG